MNGLTQSYLFKDRLLKCGPIDSGHFVVDLPPSQGEALGLLDALF